MVDAAITFLEKAVPKIQAAFKAGDISAADQQARLDRIEALRRDGFGFKR